MQTPVFPDRTAILKVAELKRLILKAESAVLFPNTNLEAIAESSLGNNSGEVWYPCKSSFVGDCAAVSGAQPSTVLCCPMLSPKKPILSEWIP